MTGNSNQRDSSDEVAWNLVDYALDQTDRTRKSDGSASAHLFQPYSFSGYDLGPMIHRGGQGIVFRATQRSTGRTVAVKVLRDGLLASAADRERLSREARILVALDHPNIVGITDSGIAAGYNYFVMDFVDGVALDEFVRASNLPFRSTLDLFAKVCEAVQAAHLKGIIHRDLKPSNIRVTSDGTPRVLDFGLAKDVEHNDNGEFRFAASITETGQFVGSLPWASPEQTRGDWDRVDTRTDVYSLGVILFQLLTGRFPYEVLGRVAEVLSSISRSDPIRPHLLNARIDSDVETIILRCLDKDQDRRYQTAGELGRDLRRYLRGEPIEAKRDSTLYVLRKKLRRYRVGVAAASLILVILAGATVTATLLLRRARVAEVASLRHAEDARSKFNLVNKTVKAVLGEMRAQFAQTVGGDAGTRPVLELAYANLVPLANERSDDPAVQADLGQMLFLLGDVALDLGRRDEGRASLLSSEAIHRKVVAENPDDLESWSDLSINLVRLGDSYGDEGKFSEQLAYYIEALHIDEDLVRRAPTNGHLGDNLGWSYERLSFLSDQSPELPPRDELLALAASCFNRLVSLEPQNPKRWFGLYLMKRLQAERAQTLGDLFAAQTLAEESVQFAEKMVALQGDNPIYLNHLAVAYRLMASVLSATGDSDETARLVDEAQRTLTKIVVTEPMDSLRLELSWETLGIKADLARRMDDWVTEDEYLQRRLDYMDQVFLPKSGGSVNALEEKFENLYAVAIRRYEHGAGESVRPLTEEAIRIAEAITSRPDVPASRLLAYSSMIRQAVPPDLRNMVKAVSLAERAVTLTNGKSIEPLQELMLALLADGQVERARDVQRQALDLLTNSDSPVRTAVMEAVPPRE
ncbi:MAG: protein kinase [Planctomycetota bacterium]